MKIKISIIEVNFRSLIKRQEIFLNYVDLSPELDNLPKSEKNKDLNGITTYNDEV